MEHLEEVELTGWAEHERDTTGPEGDPRHCPHHPHVQTSDPYGQFDAPCNECEAADHAFSEEEAPTTIDPPVAPEVEHDDQSEIPF